MDAKTWSRVVIPADLSTEPLAQGGGSSPLCHCGLALSVYCPAAQVGLSRSAASRLAPITLISHENLSGWTRMNEMICSAKTMESPMEEPVMTSGIREDCFEMEIFLLASAVRRIDSVRAQAKG